MTTKAVNKAQRGSNKASADLEHSGQPSRADRKRRAQRADRRVSDAESDSLEREALAEMGIEWFPSCENIGCK